MSWAVTQLELEARVCAHRGKRLRRAGSEVERDRIEQHELLTQADRGGTLDVERRPLPRRSSA